MASKILFLSLAFGSALAQDSYCDHVVKIDTPSKESCYGLLYKKRYVIVFGHTCLNESAARQTKVRITHHNLDLNANFTIPFNVQNFIDMPLLTHPGLNEMPIQTYHLKLLKLGHNTMFPSKLTLATNKYVPEPTDLVRLSWYPNQTNQTEASIYPIGMNYCSRNPTRSDDLFDFCGVNFDANGCPKPHGGAIIVEKGPNPVFYGIDLLFDCKSQIHAYNRIGPLYQDILRSLGSLE